MGKILFASLFVLFAVSLVFSQGCFDPPGYFGVPTSWSEGSRYCVPDSASYYECNQGSWSARPCPSESDVCVQQSASTISCQASFPSIVDCSNPTAPFGSQYCDIMQQNLYEECISGTWVSKSCPTNFRCEQVTFSDGRVMFPPLISCTEIPSPPSNNDCLPPPGYSGLSPWPHGSQYCVPDSASYYQCNQGSWSARPCPFDSDVCVQSSQTTIVCEDARTGCTNPLGINFQKICAGNTIFTCENQQWIEGTNCGQYSDCIVSGVDAYCQARGSGSGTSTGGTGTSSGGGEVSRCNKWSDWFVDSSSTYVENGQDCTKAILKRWCVLPSGAYDTSKSESKEQSECSASRETCEYVFDRSEKYTDKSATQCRECTKEIYVEQCLPSGRVNYQTAKEQLSCTGWTDCSPAPSGQTPTKSAEGQLIPPAYDFWPLIAVLVAVLLLVVLYTGWKMFTSKPEE